MEENTAQSQPAVIKMTIGITRKATGITETYELTSDPIPLEEAQKIAQPKES
jgi:hypothetical protein